MSPRPYSQEPHPGQHSKNQTNSPPLQSPSSLTLYFSPPLNTITLTPPPHNHSSTRSTHPPPQPPHQTDSHTPPLSTLHPPKASSHTSPLTSQFLHSPQTPLPPPRSKLPASPPQHPYHQPQSFSHSPHFILKPPFPNPTGIPNIYPKSRRKRIKSSRLHNLPTHCTKLCTNVQNRGRTPTPPLTPTNTVSLGSPYPATPPPTLRPPPPHKTQRPHKPTHRQKTIYCTVPQTKPPFPHTHTTNHLTPSMPNRLKNPQPQPQTQSRNRQKHKPTQHPSTPTHATPPTQKLTPIPPQL